MTTLAAKLTQLESRGVSRALCERLAQMIETAPPHTLVKISPFRSADEWQLDRFQTLDAFLHATRLGLFDLEWDLRCPHCSGSTKLESHLHRLGSHGHCAYCAIDFTAAFDDAVEVTFRVNADVRALGTLDWRDVMAARNRLTPFVPINAPAGGEHALDVDLVAGAHHIFEPGFEVGAPLWIEGEPTASLREITCVLVTDSTGKRILDIEPDVLAPGPARIRTINRTAATSELYYARAIDQPWVSGAVVASNQAFRDLFSSELIAADESFAVRSLSFVFTDIRGSTQLYERLGDSGAYARVREHFRLLVQVIDRFHGAIVKTIGDAVMATFPVAEDAMSAVLTMHDMFAEHNRATPQHDDIIIKVGLHRGPCLAVTSNDRLDYFGRTVNLAARVQGLSRGGDIVLSADHAAEPGTARLIASSGWTTHGFDAELKGIGRRVPVVQLSKE